MASGLTALCFEVGRDDLRGTFASEVILVWELNEAQWRQTRLENRKNGDLEWKKKPTTRTWAYQRFTIHHFIDVHFFFGSVTALECKLAMVLPRPLRSSWSSCFSVVAPRRFGPERQVFEAKYHRKRHTFLAVLSVEFCHFSSLYIFAFFTFSGDVNVCFVRLCHHRCSCHLHVTADDLPTSLAYVVSVLLAPKLHAFGCCVKGAYEARGVIGRSWLPLTQLDFWIWNACRTTSHLLALRDAKLHSFLPAVSSVSFLDFHLEHLPLNSLASHLGVWKAWRIYNEFVHRSVISNHSHPYAAFLWRDLRADCRNFAAGY